MVTVPWPFQRGVFRLEKLEFLFYERLDHREKSLISFFQIQGAFSLWNNPKMADFFARRFKTIINLSRKPKIFWIKALLLLFLKGFFDGGWHLGFLWCNFTNAAGFSSRFFSLNYAKSLNISKERYKCACLNLYSKKKTWFFKFQKM